MAAKKVFAYGERVRVKRPGKRAFFGKVYSEYPTNGPGSERNICVETPDGCGIGYRVRYVTKVKG